MAAPTGNIYTQTLLHSTKKIIEDRKLNQGVFTSGVGRAVYSEVELTNYGPCLVAKHQEEKSRREANKEVFTPDISRTVFEKGDSHGHQTYAKYLNESQRAENPWQLGNKGAHTSDMYRTVFERGSNSQTYAKALNESQRAKSLKQSGNKGAHSCVYMRNIY